MLLTRDAHYNLAGTFFASKLNLHSKYQSPFFLIVVDTVLGSKISYHGILASLLTSSVGFWMGVNFEAGVSEGARHGGPGVFTGP